MAARVRAPRLPDTGWVGERPDLAGSVVLLDFWTSGCVHCVRVLDELRVLEERFADCLVVVGVHTPKFPAEAAPGAAEAAARRLGVWHPVLDDADRALWSQYAVRAWPTLVVVDPEGYVAHTVTGEGHRDELAEVVAAVAAEAERRGVLRRRVPRPAPERSAGAPGGLTALADGTVVACDPAGGRVVHLATDLRTPLAVHDGFAAPRGVCRLDSRVVAVADAGADVVLRLELGSGRRSVLAGSGERRRPGDPAAGPATRVPLAAPWDVALHQADLVVACAGSHQLWRVAGGRAEVLAGTGAEQLRDGPADRAYLAQPSALAPAGDRLWFVDAESSALRWYRDGQVGTAVGSGLFAFGHRDGPAGDALLQHPEGVAVLPDGGVAVADTYNGAVRRYDPRTGEVSTWVDGLTLPVGLAVVTGGDLAVSTQDGVVRLPSGGQSGAC